MFLTEIGEPRPANPAQRDVLESGLLSSGFNVVLQMPTGSGKTWLAEQAIGDVLARGGRAVYLSPIRALATELLDRWKEQFSPHQVGIFTGEYGHAGSPYPVSFDNADLLVMTPERLDACTRAWRTHWEWIPRVELVVVDEAHLLGDRQRGARLEGTISRLRRLNPFSRLLFLSATLGNRAELADWLDGVEFVSEYRPIPLTWKVIRFRKAADKPELLVREVSRVTTAGGRSLVFVQSRRRAEQLSRFLISREVNARHHHAGLGQAVRNELEQAFRNTEIDVLVATPTLEVGVNLPVRQVVLYDMQRFDGEGYLDLSVNTVWQRVGRAGRPGMDQEGEAVILAPTWDKAASRYERGQFEPIQSALVDSRTLAEQIVAEVASGACRTRDELKRASKMSLAHFQNRLPSIEQIVDEMCDAQMLREIVPEDKPRLGIRLQATRLGRIASRHLLSPATVLTLLNGVVNRPTLTHFDMLLVAADEDQQMIDSADPYTRHYFGSIHALDTQVGRIRAMLVQAGVSNNTMLWFTSDNGPEHLYDNAPGSSGGLRGAKRSLYEGGIRVPGIIEWPNQIAAAQVTDVAAVTSDIYPTILDYLEIGATVGNEIDGVSMRPVLSGAKKYRDSGIGFESNSQIAYVDDHFKLIHQPAIASADPSLQGQRSDATESLGQNTEKILRFELYDLGQDPRETTDLSAENVDKLAELTEKLNVWRHSVAASIEHYRNVDEQANAGVQ